MSEQLLQQIISQLAALSNAVEELKTGQEKLVSANQELKSGQEQLVARIEQTQSNVNNLTSKVGQLQSNVNILGNRVEELQSNVSNLENIAKQLESNVNNLTSSVGQLQSQMNNLELRLENEVIDKVRALFDARSVYLDYFASIKNSLARIEQNLEYITNKNIEAMIRLEEHDRELRLLRLEHQSG